MTTKRRKVMLSENTTQSEIDVSFSCPHCQSENTQKLSIIFTGGTSALTAVTADVNSIGIGGAGTKGVMQTTMAKKYAPPAKQKVIGPFFAFLLIGFIANFWVSWGMTAGLIVGALCAAAAIHHNLKVYPGQFAQWNDQFLCMRCETVFTPGHH